MNAHKILIAAKKACSEERWRQGDDACGNGRTCAMLAIMIAAGTYDVKSGDEAGRAFGDAIGRPSIVTWNDAPERTLAEVHAAFDSAIAATRPTPATDAKTEERP